ncbi:hypothetical protein [Flavobacterium sp.]|uniref:hypothetical protein n=1 Tax=Flavobacterium sp. TaxID=239 RepID=UPI0039E22038
MSNHYKLSCTKIDGNTVTLHIDKLRDDIPDISDDGGLEQYCLGYLVELHQFIQSENAFPEVNNANHPMAAALEDWHWMKRGRKIIEAEGYPDVQKYEGEKVTNIFRFGGQTMLLLRPKYQEFWEESAKHFKVVSFTKEKPHTMVFEVLTPGLLHPLREGMQWESNAYNMWHFA